MNNKGQAVGWGLFLIGVLLVGIIGFAGYNMGWFSKQVSQTGVGGEVKTPAQQIVEETQKGKVAQIGVSVRSVSADNVNTKVIAPIYCTDSTGKLLIDNTASSASADTTAKTTIGETITCYAFNATWQTKQPVVIKVDSESKGGQVIDAFVVPTNTGHLQVYTDTLVTGTGGYANVTASGTNGAGTFSKLRYTVNVSNQWMPLGGLYFDTVPNSNISKIDFAGTATISGGDHATTNIVASSLGNTVTSRKELWNYVFEFNDPVYKPTGNTGNNPLLLEQNDYFDTGSVTVTSSTGCSSGGELVTMYTFSKGYYKSAVATGKDIIKYGHQTDASPGAVITTDLTGDTWYCKG